MKQLKVYKLLVDRPTWIIVNKVNIETCYLCETYDNNGQFLSCKDCGCIEDSHVKCTSINNNSDHKSYIISKDKKDQWHTLEPVSKRDDKFFISNYIKARKYFTLEDPTNIVSIDNYEYIHSTYSYFIWECMIKEYNKD